MSSRMHSRVGVAPPHRAPAPPPPPPPSRREKDSKHPGFNAHTSAASASSAVAVSAGACRRGKQASSQSSNLQQTSQIEMSTTKMTTMASMASMTSTGTKGKTVAIIGAGVSGLTCIKSCLEEELHPVCFEATKEIGGVWVYREEADQDGPGRLYRSAVTNTSKEMMGFSDFPPPPHFPPFLRHEKLLEYYENYADFFQLASKVKTETEVLAVEKADDHVISGRWVVTVRSTSKDCQDSQENEESYAEFRQGSASSLPASTAPITTGFASTPLIKRLLFDAVIVSTGILGKKNLPAEEYDGYFQFEGMVMHACQYRSPGDFIDRNVVIVGGANTAGDLAVEIGNLAKQVYLSCRHGCWVVGRTAPNSVPWDLSSYTRFNHLLLPAWFRSKLAEKFLKLRIDHEKLGLQSEKNFLQGQKMINDGIDVSILCGKVVMKPGIRSFTRDDVIFTDLTCAKDVDVVIFATGYQHHFPFLQSTSTKVSFADCGTTQSENAVIIDHSFDGEVEEEEDDQFGARKLDLYGHAFPPKERHNTLAFVGCIEPTGPVAPVIELQSRWVARVLSHRASLPVSITQRLREMRQRRARDVAAMGYSHLLRRDSRGDWVVPPSENPIVEALGRKSLPLMEYQEDLASRIGCRPSLSRLFFSDPRLFWLLLFGPCHPASYRLFGPGCWRGARSAIFDARRNTEDATRTRIATKTSTSMSGVMGGWWYWCSWFLGSFLVVAGVLIMKKVYWRDRQKEEESAVSVFIASLLGTSG